MMRLAATLLIILSVACTSIQTRPSELVLFDKIITASKTNDINALSENEYDRLVEYISEGKTRWIELYPILKKQPFLGITSLQEGLNISMAYALPENPAVVLRFINDTNINDICGIPFIEPTHQEIEDYYLKTQTGLKNLILQSPVKNKCLYTLTRIMKKIQ